MDKNKQNDKYFTEKNQQTTHWTIHHDNSSNFSVNSYMKFEEISIYSNGTHLLQWIHRKRIKWGTTKWRQLMTTPHIGLITSNLTNIWGLKKKPAHYIWIWQWSQVYSSRYVSKITIKMNEKTKNTIIWSNEMIRSWEEDFLVKWNMDIIFSKSLVHCSYLIALKSYIPYNSIYKQYLFTNLQKLKSSPHHLSVVARDFFSEGSPSSLSSSLSPEIVRFLGDEGSVLTFFCWNNRKASACEAGIGRFCKFRDVGVNPL